ncbi:Aspartate aminotransferase [Austwickia sp. TVS 96-490-7B]|uniref:aminotransferase class I/II-fold pyridoxal phosphate-dependent enzyme n=1 Tax=Austwickia sp. TVS 96-490-7B TaxID=2830843 RepID=UPI001C587208|nr:aminotransferase class I/II-fold pyridoxal phosphate-dependent enzyme [Austwickia sp. TVS 96-490-7B]MBW3083895.1 Aspartate aminotransferase [Austwickia sp. TVS 96-490-7B]
MTDANHPDRTDPSRLISGRYRDMATTPMSSSVDRATLYPDTINLSLGDPELTTDPGIIDAAAADAHAGHTHYTDSYGDPELRAQILTTYLEDHSHQHDPDGVMVTTSGCHAMWLVLESILNDGDEVIIAAPYFTPYPHQVRLARGVPVVVDTHPEDGYQLRVDALEAALTERTRAIILNTPANPTGACLSRATQEAIASLADRHDLVVIADEIYTLFSYAEPFRPFVTIPGMVERTVTINSLSKDYLMTGWRIGYVLGPSALIRVMKDVNENNVFTAPSVSQRAAVHALRRRHEIQPPIRELYRERVVHAYERVVATPGMTALSPQGSIYLWVDIRSTGLSSVEVADQIFEQAHVLTIPGIAFGDAGEGFLRLALTVDQDRIDEAFDRIARMPLFSG